MWDEVDLSDLGDFIDFDLSDMHGSRQRRSQVEGCRLIYRSKSDYKSRDPISGDEHTRGNILADWGVLVSQPQRHRLVADGLTARSVEYFMPMMEIKRRRGNEFYPLFGRYILVAVNHGWEALQYIRGVAGIMLEPEPREMVDGEFRGEPGSTQRMVPALICESELIRVMGQCADGVWIDPNKPAPTKDFVYGQAVTPTSGPFQSHTGVYDGKTRKGGDAAFFKLFGVERRMIFKSGELTAA